MSVETAESVVLERLVPDLKSQGYDVFIHPNRQMVPSFLGPYIPDIIALRDDKNLVIEIKHRNGRAEDALGDLATRFEGQSRWEFRVVWVNPSETQDELALQTPEAISARLKEVPRLLEAGFIDSALLTSWAALEAIGRKLMAGEFSRPQTPGRLVQVLAKEGYVTPDEADVLRELADMRTRFIHGELTVEARRPQVEALLEILSSLAGTIHTTEAH
jgi:uncharacterized protein YutE (UPF0331/DUF86 family)